MSESLMHQVERLTQERNRLRQKLIETETLLRAAQHELARLRQWQTDRLLKELTE